MDEVHILLKNTYKTNVMKNMISELQQSYNYPNVNFPYFFYIKKKILYPLVEGHNLQIILLGL